MSSHHNQISIANDVVEGSGITLLQMSKVDPTKLQKLDRKSTILLQAAKEEVTMDHDDPNKEVEMTEEPGMDVRAGTMPFVSYCLLYA